MTIQQIRLVQIICQISVSVSAISVLIFAAAILRIFHLSVETGVVIQDIFVASTVASAILILVVRRLECPVCANRFIGETHPSLFTKVCKHCRRGVGED
ncbi:hypothetical protein [Agitococcus lubricus]|uniref:Uncharacterized protein n=1 Tax=Agitococcus lubricus TaxID=1077255 RepID=A0A2T5J3K3_9GAMM|nr:hypothetical protein [Agitococcus lubricus]PTQ91199.1 hypothetical protein C8N29_101271 [Agitococcus lubricus]